MSLAPVIVTITPGVSAFRAALDEARRQTVLFGGVWLHFPRHERPVDRARRLRLERELRILARRADRRRRIAARKAATA